MKLTLILLLFSLHRAIPEVPLQQVPQAQPTLQVRLLANLQVDPHLQLRSPRDQVVHPMPIHTKVQDRLCIQVIFNFHSHIHLRILFLCCHPKEMDPKFIRIQTHFLALIYYALAYLNYEQSCNNFSFY